MRTEEASIPRRMTATLLLNVFLSTNPLKRDLGSGMIPGPWPLVMDDSSLRASHWKTVVSMRSYISAHALNGREETALPMQSRVRLIWERCLMYSGPSLSLPCRIAAKGQLQHPLWTPMRLHHVLPKWFIPAGRSPSPVRNHIFSASLHNALTYKNRS